MDIQYKPSELEGVQRSRNSFSGNILPEPDFDEAMFITLVIEKGIQHKGKYAETLNEYAAAFSHTKDNMTVVRAERIIRDLFRERTGLWMKEMLEGFTHRENNLTNEQKNIAYPYASEIASMIENGNKISYNRAVSHQARQCALELNITDAGAKRLMAEQFEEVQGISLHQWGRELDEKFYKPQIEAEKARSAEVRAAKQARGMSYTR
ncbi:MAG: hypothetical protein AAF478_11250 [Pseudomonadota bacterium]